jgi:hypothetical protein
MGISLTGLTPATTYDALIKVGDNGPIDGTLKVLSDGLGTNLPMEASTTGVNFTGNLTQSGTALQPVLVSGTNIKTINSTSILGSGNISVVTSPSGVAGAIQFSNGSAFASDATNLFWDDTNNRLGIGTNAPTEALEVVGQGRFSDNILFSTDFKHIGRDLNNSSISFSSINSRILAKISTGGSFEVYNSASGTSRFTVSNGGQTTISGGGSTSATRSLLVQNSAGSEAFRVYDDRTALFSKEVGINTAPVSQNALTVQAIALGRDVLRLNNVAGTLIAEYYVDTNGNGEMYVRNNAGTTKTLLTSSGGASYFVDALAVGASSANASAILDATSTTKGFLPPRMTTTQKNAIASPATGLMVMDITTLKLCVYNGSSWVDLH